MMALVDGYRKRKSAGDFGGERKKAGMRKNQYDEIQRRGYSDFTSQHALHVTGS
jgi:hypothetical protein